ncbi:uncharacterized protein LOC121374874 [Gigantopelta aegis]|uniref:uncharacterized protein LOC121374874 n=1 Tax=Gigantopelta aegis TaxID=1735272 RepID=UPI001B88AED0|nr:uncharacterized protein LOC121374874 [Gigantopelta aegis]
MHPFETIDDFDFERLFDELSEEEFTCPPLAPSSVTTTVVSSSPDATTSAMDSDDDDVFIYTPSTVVASGSPVATTSATVANSILRSILKTPYMSRQEQKRVLAMIIRSLQEFHDTL